MIVLINRIKQHLVEIKDIWMVLRIGANECLCSSVFPTPQVIPISNVRLLFALVFILSTFEKFKLFDYD